jgi:hypothetical protein
VAGAQSATAYQEANMPRILATHESTSDMVNGVKFTADKGGQKISDQVDDATAAMFDGSPIYKILPDKPTKGGAKQPASTEPDPAPPSTPPTETGADTGGAPSTEPPTA